MMNSQRAEFLATAPGTQIYLENWTSEQIPAGRAGCVFVHGGPGLYGYMGELVERVGRERPCWTYFQRGGEMSRSAGPMTVEAHCEDLRQVLERVGGAGATVVGHSWGAVLAMQTLLKYPALAKRVVLVGPMPFDLPGVQLFMGNIDARLNEDERRARAERMARFAALATAQERNVMFSELSDEIFKTYHYHPTFDRLSAKMDGVDSDAFFSSQGDLGRMMIEGDLLAPLAGFTLPVEMIYGEYDPSPCARLAEQLAGVLPRFHATAIAECGHYPWWEREDVREKFFAALGKSLN